jgi:hypothetical protein
MKIMSQFSLIPIKAYLNKEFSFCNRWGFLSRAGLWDKSHLMRQIEKYTLPLQSPPYLCANFSHFSMLLKMVCIILIAGMLIYIPPGSQISSTTPLSCTSVAMVMAVYSENLFGILIIVFSKFFFCFS